MKVKVPIFFIVFNVFAGISNTFATDITSSATKTFYLKGTVIFAIKNSPVLSEIRRTLNISKLNQKNNMADFFPDIGIKSTHAVGKNLTESNASTASNLGIELTGNLHNNGENITNYKKSKLQEVIAFLQYQQKRDQLIRTVVIDFLNFSLQQELYSIQEKNVSLLKKQYQLALEQYRQGVKTQEDVIRFKSQLQQAEISLLQSKNAIKLAKQQLSADIGYSAKEGVYSRVNFIPISLSPVNVKTLPKEKPNLYRQYPHKMILLQMKINNLDTDLQKSKYWPQVNVTAGATYGNQQQPGIVSSFGKNKQLDWQAKLELKYKLLDWGTQKRNIDISIQKGRQTIDNLNQQSLLVKKNIEDIMSKLELHKDSYKISKELQQSEIENYSTLTQSYHSGKVSYLDLTTAISNLSSAKTQYITNRYDIEKDLYSYYYYMGIIYDKIFK